PDVHFFFNHPASPRISTLSLHDALPISGGIPPGRAEAARPLQDRGPPAGRPAARLVLGQPQPGRPAAAAQLLPDLTRGAAVDRQWMARALELAERGRGYVEPNPLVGAVLVA